MYSLISMIVMRLGRNLLILGKNHNTGVGAVLFDVCHSYLVLKKKKTSLKEF